MDSNTFFCTSIKEVSAAFGQWKKIDIFSSIKSKSNLDFITTSYLKPFSVSYIDFNKLLVPTPPIYKYKKDANGNPTTEIEIDFQDNIWIGTYANGLFGLQHQGTLDDPSDDKTIQLTNGELLGALPSNKITALAADFEILSGQAEAALDRLIQFISTNQGAQRDIARTHLLELFQNFAPTEPILIAARSALSKALFWWIQSLKDIVDFLPCFISPLVWELCLGSQDFLK